MNRYIVYRCTVCTVVLPPEAEFLDKIQTQSLTSFRPCYSQPPLQLCLEISISSNHASSYLFLQILYTIKEKGGKPDRNLFPFYLWFKKSSQKPQVWELSRLVCPETSTKLYVHEFGFWIKYGACELDPAVKIRKLPVCEEAVVEIICNRDKIYCCTSSFFNKIIRPWEFITWRSKSSVASSCLKENAQLDGQFLELVCLKQPLQNYSACSFTLCLFEVP
jgi:hypothetical protein